MADVTMPQLGETVTEGTITRWFKAVGDPVARDEPLFEVSTDKVDSEVPSPADGVLTAILVAEGDTVDVGVVLAQIGDAGAAAPAAPDQSEVPVEQTASTSPEGAAAPLVPVVTTTPAAPAAAPPHAATSPPTDSMPPAPVPVPAVSSSSRGVGPLSPVVRRLLQDHGIDASSVVGSGLGGRITRGDVEAVIAGSPASVPAVSVPPTAPVTQSAPATQSVQASLAPGTGTGQTSTAQVAAPASTDRDEVIPFTNIRRRTAEHMVRSKATSAHTLMVKEVDYERVEQVRRAHGERFRGEEGFSLTYLPFVALATVEALAAFPHLNSSVGDDALIVHRDINLGIAVDLDNEGLIVPVVHRADELNLRGMSRRIHDVAVRSRAQGLTLDDISGGTFSITNAGPFGTMLTGAIINQPQVAILSTDGISRKPVVVVQDDGTETIGIHSMGLVAMNFDHRAVDGAYVARFLARLAQILDERDWVAEL